jgi:hypothetical protein
MGGLGGFATDPCPCTSSIPEHTFPVNGNQNTPAWNRRLSVPLIASLTSVQPGVEDFDRTIETVHVADGNENLTAADSAGATQRMERGEGELCLREGQPSLVAEPCVPAGAAASNRHGCWSRARNSSDSASASGTFGSSLQLTSPTFGTGSARERVAQRESALAPAAPTVGG